MDFTDDMEMVRKPPLVGLRIYNDSTTETQSFRRGGMGGMNGSNESVCYQRILLPQRDYSITHY